MTKINLGSGTSPFDGWINYDIIQHPNVISRDVLETFLPHDNNSIDFIFSEHFIEHAAKIKMINLFKECWRVLKPHGVVRLSTPNLAHVIEKYQNKQLWQLPPVWMPATLCDMVNECCHLWGHQYIWDSPELIRCLLECGFSKAYNVEYRKSEYTDLQNLEIRGYNNEVIVEAVK